MLLLRSVVTMKFFLLDHTVADVVLRREGCRYCTDLMLYLYHVIVLFSSLVINLGEYSQMPVAVVDCAELYDLHAVSNHKVLKR